MSDTYYSQPESVQEYIQLAKDVSGQQIIDAFQNYLPALSTLLELGSGPGTDFEILNKMYSVTGSDLSEPFLTHLMERFPRQEFKKLDAVTLDIDRTFRGIYSNKVLHHLSTEDLQKSIKRQHEIVKEDGYVCHSFWKGEGDEIFKGMFVNYHSEKDLESYFSALFDIKEMSTYTEFEDGDSIFLIAQRKNVYEAPESSSILSPDYSVS